MSIGFRVPFRRASQPHSTSVRFATDGDPFQFERVDYEGDGQTIYIATIYVEGQAFPVCFKLQTHEMKLTQFQRFRWTPVVLTYGSTPQVSHSRMPGTQGTMQPWHTGTSIKVLQETRDELLI